MSKQYRAVVVGYGNRGKIYADFSLICPDKLAISAVVDPVDFKLAEAKATYGLSDDRLFHTFEEFRSSGIPCDLVINATMDQFHYETAMAILEDGYDMLLEKPIAPTKEQILDIQRLAEEKGARIFVCHVLRYTPFYKKVKELIASGELGDIMAVEMYEHVGKSHYLSSYDRGKWNREETCGSSFLLAKSCHDLDLMCWLNDASTPERVSSFGHRRRFIPEMAPDGATDYCCDCPHKVTCMYEAEHEYIDLDVMPFLVWNGFQKPLDEITDEEKRAYLRRDRYGKCAYKTDGDIVDRQNVIVDFANGSIGTFNLIGGTMGPGRNLHILGTTGEIEGKLEENKLIVRRYDPTVPWGYRAEEVVFHPEENTKFGGHNGGDRAIMEDVIHYLDGDRSSLSISTFVDSAYSHLCVFAADESRREGRVVEIEPF